MNQPSFQTPTPVSLDQRVKGYDAIAQQNLYTQQQFHADNAAWIAAQNEDKARLQRESEDRRIAAQREADERRLEAHHREVMEVERLRIAAQNDQRQHELTLRSVDHRHELGLRGLDVTRAAPQPVSFWSTTQGRLLLVALGMAAIQLLVGLLRRRSRGAELLRGVQRGAGQGLVDAAFVGDDGDWD